MLLTRKLLFVVLLVTITGCSITKTTSSITAQEGIKVIKKEKLGINGWEKID